MDVLTTPTAISRPDDRPALPAPRPIEMAPLEFSVMLPDRLPEGDEWVMYGLTQRDYDTLIRNMAEIRRWVKEAAGQLRYYRGEEISEE